MSAGFVYILINASMPGVVKVGKTERDPEGRAKELSGVTGVPTPFVVVYQEFFDDCSVAEAYVHRLLEAKGYRVAANREFFSAPAQVVIQALIQAKTALRGKADGEQAAAANAPWESPAIPQSEPWEGILAQADDVRYGFGNALQDLNEAARLYQQAAKLGSAKACLKLAELYLDEDFSDANEDVAITWLKEGGRRGNAICYGRLAGVYLKHGHAENAAKCWSRFCEGSEGREGFETWAECFNYLLALADKKINIAGFKWFERHGDQIIRWGEKWLERTRERGGRLRSSFVEMQLCLVRYLLDPEAPVQRSRGSVSRWNDTDGRGFVRTASGQDAYLTAQQIVRGKLPPTVGQSADFVLVLDEKGPIACAARLFLGSEQRGDLNGLSKEEARELATELWLSSEQLLEAKAYPLSDNDWQSMATMPAGFFRRRWKLVEEQGNAAQMMKIAAVLARVIDGQLPLEGSI